MPLVAETCGAQMIRCFPPLLRWPSRPTWLSWWWGLALLWKGKTYFHSEWDFSECQGLSLTLPVSSSSSLALLLAVRPTTEPPSPYPACRRSWWNRSKAMWRKHTWLLLSCPVESLTWPGPRWEFSSLLIHTYQPIGIKQHSSISKMGTICTLYIHICILSWKYEFVEKITAGTHSIIHDYLIQ